MAQLIQWSDEISVGVEELDAQHKVLVDLINELHEAMQERRSQEVVRKVIVKLAEYTRIHFAVEESLMRILGYPGYEEHKKQHEELTKSVVELTSRVDKGKVSVSFELMYFLRSWLVNHIIESDQQYTDHFLSTGVKVKLKKRSWIESLWS